MVENRKSNNNRLRVRRVVDAPLHESPAFSSSRPTRPRRLRLRSAMDVEDRRVFLAG